MPKNRRTTGAQRANEADDLLANLAQPARRALHRAGYTRLDQLAQLPEAELLKLHGMGPKAIGQLREARAAVGWSFAAKFTHDSEANRRIHAKDHTVFVVR